MASVGKLSSYRRLQNEEEEIEREVKKAKAWLKFRALAGRKRPKVRVAGLRRFLIKRRRLVSKVKVSWRRAFQRLKNGQSHMNDLFGGNYLFMQTMPTPFRCTDKPYMAHAPHGLSSRDSRYSVGTIKIA